MIKKTTASVNDSTQKSVHLLVDTDAARTQRTKQDSEHCNYSRRYR